MVHGAFGYNFYSHLVSTNGTLNSGHYISVKFCDSTLDNLLFDPWETLCSAGLYTTAWYQYYLDLTMYIKSSASALTYTFFRSLTSRKRFTDGCRTTGSSLYASHYSLWLFPYLWNYIVSCNFTHHPISVRLNTQTYSNCYCCHSCRCRYWFLRI